MRSPTISSHTCVAGIYFDSFAVFELSAMSFALNSHKVISPSAGGGGKTESEDIFLLTQAFAVRPRETEHARIMAPNL